LLLLVRSRCLRQQAALAKVSAAAIIARTARNSVSSNAISVESIAAPPKPSMKKARPPRDQKGGPMIRHCPDSGKTGNLGLG
jgi:hypothetical protein